MRKNGFTLIELLIVIVIIAILAGAMVPVFRQTRIEAELVQLYTIADRLDKAFAIARFEYGWSNFLNTMQIFDKMNDVIQAVQGRQFLYFMGVDPTTTPQALYVTIKAVGITEFLCQRNYCPVENGYKMKWCVNNAHPYAKYLELPNPSPGCGCD